MMPTYFHLRQFLICIPAILWFTHCSNNGNSSSGASGLPGHDDVANGDDAASTDPAVNPPLPGDTGADGIDFDECAGVTEGARNTRQPADILFVIDNSQSLQDEIEMVRSNMNEFSSRIMNSGIDPRIVMISCLPGDCATQSGGGSISYGICIDPPLGAVDGCQPITATPGADTDESTPVTDDNNLPWYKHISIRIPSVKGLEWLITTYLDNNRLTEVGWHDMIRPNAVTHVVVISDDGDQMTPDSFNTAFLELDPALAGYQFHGIFAYTSKNEAGEDDPCRIYAAPSTPGVMPPIYWDTYPQLVTMTGGVSGDLCLQDFDPVFEAIGTSVIASSQINCEWVIPPPPAGESLNPNLVNVLFLADSEAEPYLIRRINERDHCDDASHAWYYDNLQDPQNIFVCPQTCDWFQSRPDAQLTIQFGCQTVVLIE